MIRQNDRAVLTGTPAGRPAFSHMGRDGEYWTFPIDVERLSGNVDTINIIMKKERLEALPVSEGSAVTVRGEVRSFNNRSGVGARLVLTVLARELEFTDGEPQNEVFLSGTLVKEPSFRQTPLGREICDLMVAVGRGYGKSDYIPCIVWGANARRAAEWPVGTRLELRGRMQSRVYTKVIGEDSVEKTAFEVSVSELSPAE